MNTCSYCPAPAPYWRSERNSEALGGFSDYPVCDEHRDGPFGLAIA